MRGILLFLYVWGCLVITEILFDKKSDLYNPQSTLSTSAKVGRVILWPVLVESEAIFLTAKDLSK